MTALNKQALVELREKFERWWEVNYHNGKPPRFGWEYWRDGGEYKVEEDGGEFDGMWKAWQAAHSSKLEAAEKRIAELEAREVVLPKPLMVLLSRSGESINAWPAYTVDSAIRAAGIKIK